MAKVLNKKLVGRAKIRELLNVVGYDADEMGFDGITGVTIEAEHDEMVKVEIRVFGRELNEQNS